MAEAARVGVVAYAARRGVTHQAVSKAIASGRLSRSVTRTPSGKYEIDPDEADREWAGNTDPQQQRERHRSAQAALFPDAEVNGRDSPAAPVLAKAQAMRVTFLAKTAELDYLEKSRSLVSADKVTVEAFRVARTVRDAILNVPARISAQLAALQDEREVREVLMRELQDALRELSDAARRE
jgi:phage terminase Nu1 subunit (DNA packaging protein)